VKVLFTTSEAYPLIKTGGLADVSGALPTALRKLKADVRILIPGYPQVLKNVKNLVPLTVLQFIPQVGTVTLMQGEMPDSNTPVYVIKHPALYERDGGPYLDAMGQNWVDNPLRFGVLSHVAAVLSSGFSPLTWKPDVVHCNDWQSGLTPAILNFFSTDHAKTVFSIHNLAYQGNFADIWVGLLGLPPQSFQPAGVEFYGNVSFLKAGIVYADSIITVSPNYAREIQTPAYAYGMDGLLRAQSAKLHGILNGIDDQQWNPLLDAHLAHPYDHAHLAGKSANKQALLQQLGLDMDAEAPLLAVVSRMAHQKGLDIVLDAASTLIQDGAQLVILGSGEPTLERDFTQFAAEHPGRVSMVIGYNEELSHQIMAGADIFLMPSRFEPCGLNQMYGLAYGTPPVVRRTGGLADSVTDTDVSTVKGVSALKKGISTGFVFDLATTDDFLTCVRRAMTLFQDKQAWHQLQQNGMKQELSWTHSAKQYMAVYRKLIKL
jgi:starch synthase